MTERRAPFEPAFTVRGTAAAASVPESDPILVDRIRDEILQGGPITFARFMERALYEPELGYYRRADAAAGRAGDFLTAPEAHPIFGHAIARQLDELWRLMGRPAESSVREYGAGGGALASSIFDGLRNEESGLHDVVRYQPVELNEHRLAQLHARFAARGVVDRLEQASGSFCGVILANEFLDALPVHLVEQRAGTLHEVFVDWSDEHGSFAEIRGKPSTAALADRLEAEGVRLDEGQRGEICLALDPWLDEVARDLLRGFVIVVDYGFVAQELYGPRHRAGTLLGYAGHRAMDDPYAAIGRQDLTAHVDLTALVAGAEARGLVHVGTTSQAEFLVGIGAGEILRRVQDDPTTTLETYAALRSALGRMLDPRGSGDFRVVMLGRDVPRDPKPAGLGFSIAR